MKREQCGRMLGVVVLMLATIGCTGIWSDHVVTTSYVATSALVACDAGQTIYASDHGRWDRITDHGTMYVETNPLLGRNPSPDLLAGIVVANAVFGAAIVESSLPRWLKLTWFGSLAIAESYLVVKDETSGLGTCGMIGRGETHVTM